MFLASLPLPKSLASASPKDLISFLVWKVQQGKTTIHTPQCCYFGQKVSKSKVLPDSLGRWYG